MTQSFREYLWDFIPPNKQELFLELIKGRTRYVSVVLEDIYQPHNASAVMRTSDCFGIQDIHIIENRNSWEYSPLVERGSSKWLSLHRYNTEANNTLACIDALRKKGYQIVATSPHAELELSNFQIENPFALIIGTEKDGVSDHFLTQADHLVKIPMVGFTESLNLSVAAAICLHHIFRQLRNSDIDWKLSSEDQEEVLLEWAKKVVVQPEKYFERYNELAKG